MRLIELIYPNYALLIQEILKTTTILYVMKVFSSSIFIDFKFLKMLILTNLGNLIYYLIIDRYIIGAGPTLISDKHNDK